MCSPCEFSSPAHHSASPEDNRWSGSFPTANLWPVLPLGAFAATFLGPAVSWFSSSDTTVSFLNATSALQGRLCLAFARRLPILILIFSTRPRPTVRLTSHGTKAMQPLI